MGTISALYVLKNESYAYGSGTTASV